MGNQIVRIISTAFLLLICSSFAYGNDSQSVPAVRYWKPTTGSSISVRTVDPYSQIPKPPARSDPKLLVVMYHNLVFGRTGNVYNRDIYNFEHDVLFLKRNFEIIDFDELQRILAKDRDVTTDVAIITFDDGDLSMYALAYPLLTEYDIKATFFIVPSYIGEIGYMSWDQIREMNDYRNNKDVALFSFESHSFSHQYLGEIQHDQLLFELNESKRILEKEIGETIDVLALPFGSGAGNQQLIEAVRNAGYSFLRTSVPLAPRIHTVDGMNIPAFNVENYSNDEFVRRVLQLTKR